MRLMVKSLQKSGTALSRRGHFLINKFFFHMFVLLDNIRTLSGEFGSFIPGQKN